MDRIFDLLEKQPALSISLGFVLAIVLAWIFKDVIISIIKKKLNLYDEDEIWEAGHSVYGGIITNDIIEELKFNRDNDKSRNSSRFFKSTRR